MTGIPAWQGATAGYSALAGHVNQFLAAHAVQYLYTGTLQVSDTTLAGGGFASYTGWVAQSFTAPAGMTATGYVLIEAAVSIGSPSPWPFSLQADIGGAPSGTPLVSAVLPKEFPLLGTYSWQPVPLPASGLTPGARYWIVAQVTGDLSDHYAWAENTGSSGASTSASGTSWTAQSYGLVFQVFDASPVLPLAGTWEDSGARWTWLGYDTAGQVAGVTEYTAGQAANGYTASNRTLTYTSGLLAGVA